MTIKNTIIKINHIVHKVMLIIAEIALAGMLATVFLTVVLRYCFNTGIGWAEEVPTLLVVLFAFIACAIGVRDHLHISVNVVYNAIPKSPKGLKIRKVMEYFGEICTLLCGLFMLVCGSSYAFKLSKLPGELPMTGWPTFIQYVPAAMGGFLITFDSILFLTGILKKDDLLYSEKEIDYHELVTHSKKGEAK